MRSTYDNDRRVTRAWITETIDAAEVHLRWCAQQLSQSRNSGGPQTFAVNLLSFQPRLFQALTLLDNAYRFVSREKKRLVSRKVELNPTWFSRRMKCLASFSTAVLQAIGVARTIGDGFAWIFYQTEYNLIDEHLKRPSAVILPPGVGGIGETALASLMPVINGNLVIYHGTTSLLRMGDFSLYDPKAHRIVSIGEIKTQHLEDDDYRSTITCVWNTAHHDPFKDMVVSGPRATSNLDRTHANRLKRQVDNYHRSLEAALAKETDERIGLDGRYHFGALERAAALATTRRMSTVQAGDALLLAALRYLPGTDLSDRLLPKRKFVAEHKLTNLTENVIAIMDDSIPENSLFFGNVGFNDNHFPQVLPGTIPFLWWPVAPEILEGMLFSEILCFVFYNPAHLWSRLRKDGYDVNVDFSGKTRKVTKRFGAKTLTVEGLSYFEMLARYSLMDDRAIVEMIESTAVVALEKGHRVRLDMVPRVVLSADQARRASHR